MRMGEKEREKGTGKQRTNRETHATLPQLRLGKKIFHAKFWASEIAGTFVRVRLKFVLN